MMFIKRHVFLLIIVIAMLILTGLLIIKYWPRPEVVVKTSDDQATMTPHTLIAQYGARPNQLFTQNPDLVQRIQEVDSGFGPDKLAFAADNEVVRLDGREFLVLRGCPDQDCLDKMTVVFWQPDSNEVYLARGHEDSTVDKNFQVQIFGQPNDATRRALLYFYSEY